MNLKDPLEYTEEELKLLSKEELNDLYNISESKERLYNTYQLVQKLIINSLYGAMANRFFPLFNEDMAAAITGNGRYFIQKLAKNIEEKLQNLSEQTKPYIVYGDTDSCVGSTLVTTDNGKIEIEKLYNTLSGIIEIRGEDNYIKHIKTPIKAASVNNKKELQFNNIKYVMKHKVKKRMFKIKCNGDEVIITEDHSLIVLRNETLTEIKPKDVSNGDKIIFLEINMKLIEENNFEIEDLGIHEEWVYDIEVENNHNFFGNNILIHNSVYYHIEPFMERYMEQNPGLSINQYVDWADNFEKKIIQPVIQKTIDDFAFELNAYNKESIGAEREIISDCVAAETLIKIKQNGKTQILSISQLANRFGANYRKKEIITLDISSENIEILSLNTETGDKELKKILNIQKKTTTKRMLDLVAPNGQMITVTEDHRIAINLNDKIIFKEAKDISEEDDVVMFDHTFYTKENQELYGLEYINYGSLHSDLNKKGKQISESKRKNFSIILENRTKEFNFRIESILKKHNGNYLKLFFRFCDVKKQSNISKNDIINFCKIKNIKLPYSLMSSLLVSRTNRKEKLREFRIKNKFGKNYFYKLSNRLKKPKNGFLNMIKRCEVINRKKYRSEKKSPLHTAKILYRNAVKKATIQSIKNNNIENIELCDKHTWNLDHIVPVMYGFHNKIPPILIGHINNLRVITKMENIKKRCKIDYELVDKELFKEYL